MTTDVTTHEIGIWNTDLFILNFYTDISFLSDMFTHLGRQRFVFENLLHREKARFVESETSYILHASTVDKNVITVKFLLGYK
jgi:hypothetical protein